MPTFDDRVLKCADCGGEYTFTAGEQEFYARKGFQQEPKRCKPCREARRTRGRGGDEGGSDESGGGPRSGGPRSGGPRSGGPVVENRTFPGDARARGGGGGGREREMFDVTCAACGAPARVPFRPTPGRPVYCRNCYGSRREGGGGGGRDNY